MPRPEKQSAAPSLPAPRFASAWAALTYVIATLTLSYPALSGAFLLNTRSDQYKAGYAFREYAASRLRSGQGFPQWNPFIEGGLPYIAAMHGDIFYPTFLLRMIMPTDMAMTWEFPIHVFLCGFFTFLFLRAWRFGFYPALAGGLAYMLGGSIAGYAGPGHDGKLFVSTMLPLTLLLITRCIRDGRIWAIGALGVTIGLSILSPHPQLFQYLLLTAGAFALYVAFADHFEIGRLPRQIAIRRLAYSAGSVILGLLIGAVQFWPAVFEYKAWSPRAAGHDYATATSYSFPIEETLNSYWPQFSGILDNYWGRNNIHFHSDYFGVIVLMLFGAAFGATAFKSFRRFWIATGVISLLWAFGGYTPFFNLILALVPGTKYFRAPSTMIYVTAFAVSVVAAIGMERLLERKIGKRYIIGWLVAGGAIALLATVGGYKAISSTLISGFGLDPQFLDYLSQRATENAGAAIAGAWRSLLVVGVGAGLLWAMLTDRLPARTAIIGLLAVLVIDLWSIERMYWVFSPRANVLYATDGAIDAIKADIRKTGEPGRVWTEERLGGKIVRDPNFVGDALMTHGLRLVGVYHGNELGVYQNIVGPEYRQSETVVSPAFWRHENVRYLYTGADDSTIAQFAAKIGYPNAPVKLAGPVQSAAGSTVFAYRLPGNQRPAWVATALVKAPEDQARAAVLDPRFDPTRIAVLDTGAAGIPAQNPQALPEGSLVTARVSAVTDRSYSIALDRPAPAGSALVVSENYYPGWQATVNGSPAPVARVNYNLIGVALPAGARSVELTFTDAAYQKGKIVTLVALAACLFLWIGGAMWDRRSARVQPA
jgi:hypothetical protein